MVPIHSISVVRGSALSCALCTLLRTQSPPPINRRHKCAATKNTVFAAITKDSIHAIESQESQHQTEINNPFSTTQLTIQPTNPFIIILTNHMIIPYHLINNFTQNLINHITNKPILINQLIHHLIKYFKT